MLSDRAKALRPMIQAAYDAGGLDGVCKAVAGLIAPLEVCVEQLMARVAELEKRLNMNRSNSSNLITDFWGSYDTLEKCDHSRCNAHLLRELTSFSEDGHR